MTTIYRWLIETVIHMACWCGLHKSEGYSEKAGGVEWYCVECGRTTQEAKNVE